MELTVKIYHQAGHNTIWNIDSFSNNIGDGVILSPVHYADRNIRSLDSDIKSQSLFDPQYYMPNSQKSKLQTYDFFPEKIMNGFETVDFCTVAHQSASLCLKYQLENNFEAIIIPCRYFQDMVSDYVSQQLAFTVDPFLSQISKSKPKKDVFLTLPLTISMIRDTNYRTAILNWVTSYPEIQGVYLLINFDERTKQIHEYEKLYSYTTFIRELIDADLQVICGYSNLEGLIISLFDVWGITIGAYENTRKFSLDKFIDDDKIQMGPAPRIYLPGLLNWIRYDTAKEIMEDCPTLWDKSYTNTPEGDSVLATAKAPHFSQPTLYKHYFRLANNEYNELFKLTPKQRHTTLVERVNNAISLYKSLIHEEVQFFDENCSGGHLNTWRRVLKNLKGIF